MIPMATTVNHHGSPVKDALTAILDEARIAGMTADWRVVSYREDFAELWGVGSHHGGGMLASLASGAVPNLIVVWDGVPSDTTVQSVINIADYVTVYDWIVALCSSLSQHGAAPAPRLFIVDLTPRASSSAFGSRVLPSFLSQLPWIRVYRPVARYEDVARSIRGNLPSARDHDNGAMLLRRIDGPDSLGAESLYDDLGVPSGAPADYSIDHADLKSVAELLRRLWTDEITRAETRHSLSNIVAPLVLARGLVARNWAGSQDVLDCLTSDLPRMALSVLLELLSILQKTTKTGGYIQDGNQLPGLVNDGHTFPSGDDDVFGQFQDVRVLLVDDQRSLGYLDILSCFLFGDAKKQCCRGISLRARESPACLIKALYEGAGLKEPAGLSLAEPDEKSCLRWLLDFYHRSGACQYLADRDPVLKSAASAARRRLQQLERESPSDSPDPTCDRCGAVPGPEQPAPIDWDLPHELGTNGDPEQGTSFDILLLDLRLFPSDPAEEKQGTEIVRHLLLPLLLSHFDPSLPIILFSSTQQRTLMEALAPRRNIITTFSKPIISGYRESREAAAWITDLQLAVQEATRLHEIRVVWRSLTACQDWKTPPAFEVFDPTTGKWTVYNCRILKSQLPQRWTAGQWVEREIAPVPPPQLPDFAAGPRLKGDTLIKRLKDDYCRYLLTGRDFDYLSVPWEILEGTLPPMRLLNDPSVNSPYFGLSEEMDPPDNALTRIFRLIRHNKVHGHADHLGRRLWNEQGEHNRLTTLLFHTFLDFIRRPGMNHSPDWPFLLGKVLWNLAKSYVSIRKHLQNEEKQYNRRGRQSRWVDLPAEGLTSSTKVTWPDFALFVMADACWRAKSGSVVSGTAVHALHCLATRALRTKLGRDEEIRHGVVRRMAGGAVRWEIRDLVSGRSLGSTKAKDLTGLALVDTDHVVYRAIPKGNAYQADDILLV